MILLYNSSLYCAYTLVLQMVLLYKDPHGKNSAVVNTQTERNLSGFTLQHVNSNKCEELEKKVTTLEKLLLENETTIAELRNKVNTSNSTLCSDDHIQVNIEMCT